MCDENQDDRAPDGENHSDDGDNLGNNHDSRSSTGSEPFHGFENKNQDAMLMQLISQMSNVLHNQQLQLNQLLQGSNQPTNHRDPGTESVSGLSVTHSSMTPQFNVMPDLLRNLKEFSGTESTREARAWLRSLNSAATIHQWTDAVKLEAARTRLKNAAENWYIDCQEDVTTWRKFEEEFTLAFIGEESLTEKWTAMHSRVQLKGEDINDYFYDKLRLCSALGMTFKESKRQIIEGLWSKDLSNHLLGTQHKDKYELLNSMKDYLAMVKARTARARDRSPVKHRNPVSMVNEGKRLPNDGLAKIPFSKPVVEQSNSTFKKVVPFVSSHPQQDLGTDAQPPNLRKTDPRCYNCQKYGHISKDCPEPKKPLKCLSCKMEGHTSKYCQVKSQALVATERSNIVSLNPFQKGVTINSINMLGMIDSGVQYCLIRASAAVRSGLKIQSSATPLYGVGNVDIPSIHTLGKANCTITIDNVEVPKVFVYVLPDQAIPVDILVGREWLHNPRVNYYRKGDSLAIEEVVNPLSDISIDSQHSNANEQKVYSCLVNDCVTALTEEQLLIDAEASTEERQKVIELCNEFRCCFALDLQELGCTDVCEMKIQEVEGSKPFVSKPYKTSASERDEIKNIVADWRRHGIVEETCSPYASPVLLVSKKTGEKRLCVDYRRLNRQTIRLPYPLPDLDSQLETLNDAHVFATLDLAHGFLQIPLSEDSRRKTAFVTPDETAQFVRMPFGLTNAPAEFQKLMNKVLGPLRNTIVQCYLDDLLIPAKDWETLLMRLRLVFEALRAARLTLKPSKCQFGVKTVEFLGFVISNGTIRPGERKTLAISKYPTPNNVHEVRRFLGLTGFFRRFVKNYAELSTPLTYLTRKDVDFRWDTGQEEAFQKLKVILTTEPVLKLYDPKAYTEVHTDASSLGLAGVLLQRSSDDRDLHLVYCVSKKVSATERHYHSSRLELMAIVWTLNRLRPYLLGREFTILTDCQSLVYMNVHRTRNPQIARWVDQLQEYNFEIRHRNGNRMTHVDALSRAPVEDAEEPEDLACPKNFACLGLTKEEQVAMMQHSDGDLQYLISLIQKSTPSETNKALMTGYCLQNGILYRKEQSKLLFVVPKPMRKSIVVTYHDLSGHFGLERTIDKIKEHYWFSGMRRYVKQHIRMCFQCLLVKKPSGKKAGLLHPIAPGKRPFEVINIDHVGPFETKSGCSWIFVVVDNLTKFVRLFAVKGTTTKFVIKCLELLFNEKGLPNRIISDRGTCFTSHEFEEFCTSNGILHSLNSSRHPQANGQVERVNRTLVPTIAASLQNKNNWVNVLPEVERNLNSSGNKTTGKSPFELLYGYKPRFHFGVLNDVLPTADHYEIPEVLREKAHDKILEEQKKMKITFDKRHITGDKYDIGEVVVMQRAPEHTGQPTKLQDKYRGPLVVVDVLPNDTYRVRDLNPIGSRMYCTTAHSSQLKSWKIFNQDDFNDEEGEKSEEGEGGPYCSEELPSSKRVRNKPSYLTDYILE